MPSLSPSEILIILGVIAFKFLDKVIERLGDDAYSAVKRRVNKKRKRR